MYEGPYNELNAIYLWRNIQTGHSRYANHCPSPSPSCFCPFNIHSSKEKYLACGWGRRRRIVISGTIHTRRCTTLSSDRIRRSRIACGPTGSVAAEVSEFVTLIYILIGSDLVLKTAKGVLTKNQQDMAYIRLWRDHTGQKGRRHLPSLKLNLSLIILVFFLKNLRHGMPNYKMV